MNNEKIKKAAAIAKARTNDKRWIAAIDKAVVGIESGGWIVTYEPHGIMVTTDSLNTYRTNGTCECRAFAVGQPCKHRALARLVEIADSLKEETVGAVSTPAESRARLIADITNNWPKTWAPMAVELMARFRCNSLKFLDDDMLRRVRLAISM